MKIREFNFSFDELGLSVESIEQFVGYEKGGAPQSIRQLIEDGLAVAAEHCAVKGGYLLFDDVISDPYSKTVSIGEVQFDVQKIIYIQLKKAEAAALFVCTAGNSISSYADILMQQGELAEAYIVDTIGSEIVETAMDKIQAELEREVKSSGYTSTNRYSPGYCGWDLVEQQKLFSLLPPKFCGIRLTPASMMQPEKSVSGIIGIGKKVKKSAYKCRGCQMISCVYRKKKYKASAVF